MATEETTLKDLPPFGDRPCCIVGIIGENLLSFGESTASLYLTSLNVLIGPNASGKSNFLEQLLLLRSTTTDFRNVLAMGGGTEEWIWKGAKDKPASVGIIVSHSSEDDVLTHVVTFRPAGHSAELRGEFISRVFGELRYTAYRNHFGDCRIRPQGSGGELIPVKLDPALSVLAQRRDPDNFPDIGFLDALYSSIRIYKEWSFGRNSVFRRPQSADLRNDRLEEDFSNLGMFLSKLRKNPKTKKALLDGLKDLYEGLTDFDVSVEGGTVQVFFTEGEFSIPATRLSDGTLRYLCLLAILCDPNPPPLVCIEEPELGLHPDLISKLADRLIEASSRMQLIVTTHSDILVDALSDVPESVVVCEKHDGKTTFKRLIAEELAPFLEKYRLGQLWIQGQIGGTRW